MTRTPPVTSRQAIHLEANPEAERAVIAALIRNPDPRLILDHHITSDLFVSPMRAEAFDGIVDLILDGTPPDMATLRGAISDASMVEAETSLSEHASAANIAAYVGKLKEVKRARIESTARDQLSAAILEGKLPHELAELFDAVRAASIGDPSDKTAPPPFRPLNLDALDAARLHPRCIVENLLYADLALVNAEGGTGKTTLLLYEAIHIALGRDLWGCRVLNPGRTLFITAEDGEELLQARLREVMTALGLTDYERRKVCENFMVWDVTGSIVRLAELDARGNLQITALTNQIVETYRDAGLVQVIFDPAISFSPGERIINDGEQAIVTACRRIVRSLSCCVRLIHHSGQANARNGAMDQYAGRGGTALPDGCRMVTILANANRVNIQKPDGYDLQPGESGFVMARAKLSYAPPQPNIWIRRHGWTFEYFIEEPRNSDIARDRDADRVADFLAEELPHGRRYTANTLELSGKAGMPRARLRAALATLETTGRLEERELPADQRRGKRKTYLHPYKAAVTVGGIAADMTQNNPAFPPNPPPVINPPPYREINGGGIDAAFISPGSLQSAKDNGGIAAEWRNSGESGSHGASQPTANHPTTETNGIGGTDELSQPTPPSTGQAPSFPGSKGGPVISQHPGEAPTAPLSPLGGRILKAVQATSAGFDTNELARQVGNGKGASMVMMEHELAELAKRGLVNRINGRWVAATPSTMGRGTP